MTARRPLVLALAALVAAACAAPRPVPSSPAAPALVALDSAFEPLRARFVADTGHPRLAVLVSPT